MVPMLSYLKVSWLLQMQNLFRLVCVTVVYWNNCLCPKQITFQWKTSRSALLNEKAESLAKECMPHSSRISCHLLVKWKTWEKYKWWLPRVMISDSVLKVVDRNRNHEYVMCGKSSFSVSFSPPPPKKNFKCDVNLCIFVNIIYPDFE